MLHRLFIGIRPPKDIRDKLLDIMGGVEGARWQDDGQLHLTLAFVGEVDRHRANDLAEILGEVRVEAFALSVEGVGAFERKGRTTALWARVPMLPELDRLRRKVERACERVGAAPEHRRFIPHITLARLNSATGPVERFLEAHSDLRLGPFAVDRFTLFESHLGQGGSVYEAVAEYGLDRPD